VQAFEQKQFVYIENLTDSIAWSIMLSPPPENREERVRNTTLALIFVFLNVTIIKCAKIKSRQSTEKNEKPDLLVGEDSIRFNEF